MKNTILLILSLFFLNSCVIKINTANSQKGSNGQSAKTENKYNQKLADSLGADQYGMKPYVLVILKTGSATIKDKVKITNLMNGHMRNIGKLAKEGKLTIAGPFSGKNEKNYRGLFIFNVKTKEEAEILVKTDPAVEAGVFDYEIYNWYGSSALPKYLDYHEKISKENP